MILLQTGDWQLDSQPGYDRIDPTTERSTRFHENIEINERVIDDAIAAGATGMNHLGDLTEKRNPNSLEMEAAAHLFTRFMDKGGRIWAEAGNHDGALFRVSGSSFAPLAAMRKKEFKLFHRVEFDTELNMLAIPYIHRATPEQIREMAAEAVRGLEIKGPCFASIHYGLKGAQVGPRNLVLPGDYLGPSEFPAINLDHIFAGHIHKAQEIQMAAAKGWHPGSTVICDQGERADRKTYILFNTVTRQVIVKEVPQRRRWITVAYNPKMAENMPEWGAEDLVKITGTFDKPDYPKATIEAAFKAGMVRPFALEIEVKAAKVERAMRSMSVTKEGGLKDALQGYVREKYPNFTKEPGQVGPATAKALDTLREQGGLTYCEQIEPTNLTLKNFMTFEDYDGEFQAGNPLMITADNGTGKTNFFEAILWTATGETSKGISLGGAVRQGAQECENVLSLIGHKTEEENQAFRITRGVKLKKDGKASQKLLLERWDRVKEAWDQSMSDGTMADIQARIDNLLGGGFLTMRTANFKFQNDKSPFITAPASQRKAVVGEVTGLAPLYRAHKILDKERLDSARALEAGKNQLAGAVAAGEGNEERIATLKKDEEEATTSLQAAQAEITPAEAQQVLAAAQAETAKTKVAAAEAQLQAQPNTQATALAASQAVETYEASYQAQRGEKLRQHGQAKADITAAEAELAATKAPDRASMDLMLSIERAATVGLDSIREEVSGHRTNLSAAASLGTTTAAAVKTSRESLKTAEAALATIGVLPTAEESMEAASHAQAEAREADSRFSVAMTAATTAREAKKVIAEKGAALLEEKKAFDGKDMDACIRCGQPIDSTHIKKELARLDAEIQQNLAAAIEAGKVSATADKEMLEANSAKTEAQAREKKATEDAGAIALKRQTKTVLEAKVQDLQSQVTQDENAAYKAAGAAKELNEKLDKASIAFTEALAILKIATANLETARDAAQKVESTRGRLDALRIQLAGIEEAGIREKQAHEIETVRLKALADKARQEHETQQVITQAIRDQVTAARAEVDTAAAAETAARLALAAIRSRITTAETRIQDFRTAIKRIEDQMGALKTARFELKLLEERAEIDEIAAGLLDPRIGLPVFLIDQALPFLEDRINLYIAKLGIDNITVELTTIDGDKETLAIMVDNGHPGPKLDIIAYSGGELDRIEYGVKCAMADLSRQTRGVTFGLNCFDEPSGGLSASGKEALINLLYERAPTYPVTIITSHDDTLLRAFPNQIRFVKGPHRETMVAGAVPRPKAEQPELEMVA